MTLGSSDQPKKRYMRLKQWFDLANMALPVLERRETQHHPVVGVERTEAEKKAFFEKLRHYSSFKREDELISLENKVIRDINSYLATAPESADFPTTALRNLRVKESPGGLLRLATRVAEALKFCTLKHTPPDRASLLEGRYENYRTDQIKQPTPEGQVLLDRAEEVLTIRSSEPYRDCFLCALQGVEIGRIRRCPVCSKFYFALRFGRQSKYDSKACSKGCNQVRRVRDWRSNQRSYEQNRKFRSAGLEPKG